MKTANNNIFQAQHADMMLKLWRDRFPEAGVYLDKLRGLPILSFEPHHNVPAPPRGPDQRAPRPRHPVPPALMVELGRLFKLADDEGHFKRYLAASNITENDTARSRAAVARVMSAAAEEILAGQYPHVEVRCMWAKNPRPGIFGGKPWKLHIVYDLKEVPNGPAK